MLFRLQICRHGDFLASATGKKRDVNVAEGESGSAITDPSSSTFLSSSSCCSKLGFITTVVNSFANLPFSSFLIYRTSTLPSSTTTPLIFFPRCFNSSQITPISSLLKLSVFFLAHRTCNFLSSTMKMRTDTKVDATEAATTSTIDISGSE